MKTKTCVKGGLKREGASCSMNNNCIYPDCMELPTNDIKTIPFNNGHILVDLEATIQEGDSIYCPKEEAFTDEDRIYQIKLFDDSRTSHVIKGTDGIWYSHSYGVKIIAASPKLGDLPTVEEYNKSEVMAERVLCAAIWYLDLPTQTFKAINQDKGLIICGHRHSHCIDIVKNLAQLRTVKISPDGVGETIQGFLTNTNRFVDRKEALEIAIKQHQLYNKSGAEIEIMTQLYSEDLY